MKFGDRDRDDVDVDPAKLMGVRGFVSSCVLSCGTSWGALQKAKTSIQIDKLPPALVHDSHVIKSPD